MRKLLVALALVLGGLVFAASPVWAQTRTRPSQDHFESRRNQAAWENKVRQQQELAKRRPPVPTFTFHQPVQGGYGDYPYMGGGYGGGDGQYVLVPGGYQMVYGQLVYVPPHYEFVPRWYR